MEPDWEALERSQHEEAWEMWERERDEEFNEEMWTDYDDE